MSALDDQPIVFDPANLDLSALGWNPSVGEVRTALRRDLSGNRSDGVPMRTIELPERWPGWASVVGFLVVGALIAVSVPLFSGGEWWARGLAVVLLGGAVITAVIVLAARAFFRYLGRTSAAGFARVKLERLAADNAWDYRHRGHTPRLPGGLFTTTAAGADVYDQFSTFVPNALIFGNYNPASSAGHSRSPIAPLPERSWGFLAIRAQRDLPSLLLVSQTREPGDLELPIVPRTHRTISLEGDFDRYFRLYCPVDSQVEALSLIAPDLMALLIDKATPFDVEVDDHWVLFYSRVPFDLLDPALYRRLFDIVKVIGGKIERA